MVWLHHIQLLSLLTAVGIHAAHQWHGVWSVFSAGIALYSAKDGPHSHILDYGFHVSEQVYTSPHSLQKERSCSKP